MIKLIFLFRVGERLVQGGAHSGLMLSSMREDTSGEPRGGEQAL